MSSGLKQFDTDEPEEDLEIDEEDEFPEEEEETEKIREPKPMGSKDFLKSFIEEDGISEKDYKKIIELKYTSGSRVYDRNDMQSLLDVAHMIRTNPKSVLPELKESSQKVGKFYWNGSLIEPVRKKYDITIKNILTPPKGVEIKGKKCKGCKGTNYDMNVKQTRSGDEPQTLFMKCLKCGLSSKESAA